MKTGLSSRLWAAAWLGLSLPAAADQTLFFDDFQGQAIKALWQVDLPDNAYSGSFPFGSFQTAAYLGAPHPRFEKRGTNTILRLTATLNNLQRLGWSSAASFTAADFVYDVRFNTLVQSPATSIDGFIEIWIIDAADNRRYDIVSPFGGSYDGTPTFFVGSSIDGGCTQAPFRYQNNTWYHLVLQAAAGGNLRASIYDDRGYELIGRNLAHNASAFNAGFKLGLSQMLGFAQGIYPVDVAVDYARLTTSAAPAATAPPPVAARPALVVPAQGPVLNWQKTGSNLMLGWPYTSTGYVLEASASLAPAEWIPVTNPPFQAADQFVVPVAATAANRFFRLHYTGN
jgi:hypothetical protein